MNSHLSRYERRLPCRQVHSSRGAVANDGALHQGTSAKDKAPDTKQNIHLTEPHQPWESPDSAKAWGEINEVVTKYDEKLVGDWKDELGNLLIFVRHLFRGSVVPALTHKPN